MTATAQDPLVHQCMRGCLGLSYDFFGIYNAADCICGTGAPTTSPSSECEPCEIDLDGYECGAAERTSVYRDFNRVWEAPTYEQYHPPPPPSLPAAHDGQFALTPEEMAQLFAKLDRDHTGTIEVNEMIDVFDLVDNGALTVRDCQGNMYPHRWIGDGFCDDGTDTEDGAPDCNCATFECDKNDCATGCVAAPDHDRVNIIADTLTAANYGEIAAMGEVWWSKFDAAAGETYSFTGQTGNQTQDLVPGGDGTWLTVTLKEVATSSVVAELELTTPGSIVASDPCTVPNCEGIATDPTQTCDLDPATDGTAECPEGCDGDNWLGTDPCPIMNTWTNDGEARTIHLETRVRRTDDICTMTPASGEVTGAAVDHKGVCYVAVGNSQELFTFAQATAECEAASMTLASIRAPDQESFVETHVLRAAPTNKHWIGALKGQNSGWGWVDAQQFFWEDWEDGEGEEAADVAACGTLNHDSSHSLDGWTSEECESAVGGFICMKDTELSVPEAAGLFKLFVTTPDGELAAAEEPPLWATVLWARSGYNSSVAAASGAFADRPTYAPPPPCVNVLDEQNGNATQCQIMQDYGFDCLTYFCPNCEYANYCDLACDFCGDELYPPGSGGPDEPREDLVIPDPEPEPWIDEDDPSCLDAYDHQGGASASQIPNRCEYYRASEPDYQPLLANGVIVGDAAFCQLGPNELNDGAVCLSQMRTDEPALAACVYTPAPQTTSQCDLMLQTGFDCATWMCSDAATCPYSGFCDRTCGFCMRGEGWPCTPLSAMDGYYIQRAQTGNEFCRGGVCAIDDQGNTGCTALPYCEVESCDSAFGTAESNPAGATCRQCVAGTGDCPTDCSCDPACDAAPAGAWCLMDAECDSGSCDMTTTLCE
jgi:hypothetical protein